jgi:MFS family permease
LPVAVVAGIAASGFVLPRAFMDTLPLNEAPGYEIDNPIGIEGVGSVENLLIFGVLLNGLLVIAFVGTAASVVVRFRRSRGVERLQMKWFVYVSVVFVGGSILTSVIGVATGLRWLEQFSFVLSMVALVGLPIAVGIAILRYRLYDIDVVINRTLVYGLLTLLLALMYFGGIVLLQRVFVLLTGQQSTLAVVASTLLIAALFNPLRGRIQAFIDRAFYRRKYDARKTLETFSARLRDETDLEALNSEVVGVVRETIQPAHVSVWLRPETAAKGEQAD